MFALKKKVSCDQDTTDSSSIQRTQFQNFILLSQPVYLLALYFRSDDAVKVTVFPENSHWLNLFFTSDYLLCETFTAKCST